jgi:hypothetical protein
MALNGRDIRNAVLKNLTPLLWYGLVNQAIAYLKSLPEAEIKNEDELIHLVQYLAKNRPIIPVYAVRRELGLRNSSNRGEKANDLLVAERQKHKGMSWSLSGSVALASVTALKHNREYHKWFRERLRLHSRRSGKTTCTGGTYSKASAKRRFIVMRWISAP